MTLSKEETTELRIIIARLIDYLEGNWKVWLPYDDTTSRSKLFFLLDKLQKLEEEK